MIEIEATQIKETKNDKVLVLEKEECLYLECNSPELSGNYSLFYYSDGYLTAYNEDAKVENYFTVEHFTTKFLKQNEIQQLEPVLYQQNTVG
jgi:hypothetical protein